ncbi:8286_t:CDS:2, partial [Gigaspora margarita]
MKKRSIIMVFVVWVVLIQGVFSQVKKCNPANNYCLTVTIPNTANADDVATFEMTAPSTIGWIAMGIGDSMVGSYIVMAWPTTTNSVAISQRVAYRYSVPEVTNQQSDIKLLPSSGIKDDVFTVVFTRPLIVANSTISSATSEYVWALHTTARPSDDPSTMTITRHNDIGHITLTGTISNYDKYIIAHGLLMFFTWGIITPGAIFIARFTRNIIPRQWFPLHWGIMSFLAVPWFGRTLAVGSFYQISLGLAQYNVGKPLVTAYYVWIMIIIISYFSFSIYLWRKRTSEIKKHGSSNVLYTGIRKQDDREQTE